MSNSNSDISDKMRHIDLQVDTIPDMNSTKGGYFSPDKNTITINYKNNNNDWNRWTEGEAVLTHEQKHRDNAMKGMHAWPVSPEQAYKLEMHDEISANIAELLSLRQKYLETGDISIFDDKGSSFHFYKNAILSGEIKPNSPYKEDFDKEMSLIVNGTSKMWQDTFAPNKYIENGVSHGVFHGDVNGTYAKYHNENYENGKKIAYTIGGVDFTQYLNRDVDIPEKGKEALKDALKNGVSKPESGYQRFLAKSCDFFGVDTDFKSNVIGAAQGKKGIMGQIMAPIGATVSAAMGGTYNRLKNAYHKVVTPENKQTHPVNTGNPQYREWKNEDGHRVSPIQHRQILDMNKDIIRKPTKSYATEGKNTNKQKTTLKNVSQQKMPGVEIPQSSYLEQKPSTIQSNRPVQPILSSSAHHLDLQPSALKTKIKDDNQKAHKIVDSLNIKNIRSYVEEQQEKVHRFLDNNWKKLQSRANKRSDTSVSSNNGKTQELKGKIQKDKHSADNKYQQQMLAMIQNMNKINGPQKSIDAQKTTDILYQKYGDNAYPLLLKAIQEPTNYSQITGDSSIKTSRAAVQHLSALENNEKTQMIINNLLKSREK